MIDLTRHSRAIAAALILSGAASAALAAAALTSDTRARWDAYVEATEARIERELESPRGFLAQDFTPSAPTARKTVLAGDVVVARMATTDGNGREVPVPDGMIHHWRGSVFVPGVTRDGLLAKLQNPSETGPHQEDVLALKVLARQPDRLRLFIRMTRTKIVTVTYDTEHEVTYRRYGATRASSRSVATKIAELQEVGTADERERPHGEDRGFLWRLHSYWRYEEAGSGVIVELESLTLSRTVPFGLGPVVEPLIDRVARESVRRTLENLRRTHATMTTTADR